MRRLPPGIKEILGQISAYQKLGSLESCPARICLANNPFTTEGIFKVSSKSSSLLTALAGCWFAWAACINTGTAAAGCSKLQDHMACLQWPFHGTCSAAYINGSIVAKRLKTPYSYAHRETEFHCKGRYVLHAELGALAAALAAEFNIR